MKKKYPAYLDCVDTTSLPLFLVDVWCNYVNQTELGIEGGTTPEMFHAAQSANKDAAEKRQIVAKKARLNVAPAEKVHPSSAKARATKALPHNITSTDFKMPSKEERLAVLHEFEHNL